MSILYKVSRWDKKEIDITVVDVIRQTDKTVWFMRNNHEQKELKISKYYKYFESKADAISLIQSRADQDNQEKARKILNESAPALLQALESLVESLSANDEEGLIEHSVHMVNARLAIKQARGE
jgi:hypothetical protein